MRGDGESLVTLARALAVLDPDSVGLYAEARQALASEWKAQVRRYAALTQLRRRVATLVIPPSHQAAVAAVLSALDHQ
jgi:hypothetical protein